MFRFCSEFEPKHNSVLMITYSGGSSVLDMDAISRLNAGIDVPAIREPTLSKMKTLIKVGSINNPLDLPDLWDENIRFEIFKHAINEEYISGVIQLHLGPRRMRGRNPDEKVIERVYTSILQYKDTCRQLRKPFMIYLPSTNDIEFRNKLIELEIPSFTSFSRAAKAFSNLYHYKNRKSNHL